MNRYAASRRDRTASLWASLIITALILTLLGVVAARVTGAVTDGLDGLRTEQGATR